MDADRESFLRRRRPLWIVLIVISLAFSIYFAIRGDWRQAAFGLAPAIGMAILLWATPGRRGVTGGLDAAVAKTVRRLDAKSGDRP